MMIYIYHSIAIGSALYGLQKLSSDKTEVRSLVAALAEKVETSTTGKVVDDDDVVGIVFLFCYHLYYDFPHNLHHHHYYLYHNYYVGLDAQAIGNALFGLQRMKSNSPEVRTLVQAIATKLVLLEVQMDSKGIGSALYGMYIYG